MADAVELLTRRFDGHEVEFEQNLGNSPSLESVLADVNQVASTGFRNSDWTERGGGTKVGFTPDGSLVDLYGLEHEGIDAAIMTHGARLTSLRTPDRYGKMEDVILNYSVLDSYLADRSCYLGAIVGRYANRIASGRISVGDRTYQAVTNDHGNALHGGKVGFDQQIWSARPLRSGVELTLTSPDGDQGFPGNLTVRVRYTISANALRIDYLCSTDQTTVVNLTNHTYFNLSGRSDTTILDDELTISADRFTPVDSALIPTGKLSPVEGTPFDFRSKAVIGERIGARHEQLEITGGYDHNFVLNGTAGELRTVARLHSPESGRTLRVSTTEPGLQFYTGHFLDNEQYGKASEGHGRHAGLCLETQHFPDSPNHPSFPTTELRPGRVRRSTTIFEFSVDN
jgi:aldose 1-epimerase